MRALDTAVRRVLSDAVLAGRREAESACKAAVEGLGVFADRRPDHLTEAQVELRIGLRAKWRQLGRQDELLVSECAYEQWHRLLFARFLAENGLLLHPEFLAPVSVAECEDLAPELGEPDGWSVAARFAAEILPGIFRLDDPCVKLRLAPEGRDALERIVTGLPVEVFLADDALGWVYQFWQKNKKDEINNSERKIGGADLGPVTQLFTENYMVRFLLENSLGAWWAGRHPDSPLLGGFDYLRFDDDGNPAAGTFEEWPTKVAEVTVMDPCCGSGHFLVEAFSMLWQMRAEEEQLDPITAQDAVLRNNLFGLELDPRCVQIAMFAVALQAWKAGGGWRELPTPNIACSGIPVKAPVEEWTAFAEGEERLENALVRLHILFQEADTLGSLIDPKRGSEARDTHGHQQSFEQADWDEIFPLIERATQREERDPATLVLGADAAGTARAAGLLSRTYTLVATNVPYLKRGNQAEALQKWADISAPSSKSDLATIFIDRTIRSMCVTAVCVTPQSWIYQAYYKTFRAEILASTRLDFLVVLGAGAFGSISGEVVNVVLVGISRARPSSFMTLDITRSTDPVSKSLECQREPVELYDQRIQANHPDSIVILDREWDKSKSLEVYAGAYIGLHMADNPRFKRGFWELSNDLLAARWRPIQSTVETTTDYGGRSEVAYWPDNGRIHLDNPAARIQGRSAWSHNGVLISLMGNLRASLYEGDLFDNNTAAIVPRDPQLLAPLWAYCSSAEFDKRVRIVDRSLKATNSSLIKVPFDVEHWRRVAEDQFPDGLPEPYSDDPTQWLFEGRPEASSGPLQVAVARLLGYRWPEQSGPDDLDPFADTDGIVCLPSVKGEAPAVDRLNALLAAAFGESWAGSMANQLIVQTGSKKTSLTEWLRDDFFKQHCAVFGKRPFIWHIWDGQRDGFSALVNYHRLDHKNLERLTYTYLGDWIERQRAATADDTTGADKRLGSALGLQRKLEAILEGESPYDIYIRWKDKREQPIGWNPDLNDGVRLNIRPFVEAGVLRSKFSIHWNKDRGKNLDGSERHNDLHLTLAEKRAAREGTRT